MLRISFDGLLAQAALESFLDCLEKVELRASSGSVRREHFISFPGQSQMPALKLWKSSNHQTARLNQSSVEANVGVISFPFRLHFNSNVFIGLTSRHFPHDNCFSLSAQDSNLCFYTMPWSCMREWGLCGAAKDDLPVEAANFAGGAILRVILQGA
ncbi:hypothetical protein DKX38_027047 [Salix brachista]|uniref:Uncharacterized protein n=1 Tax=Salix brachista TaxID=2182728 RepID=A0A5N5JB17_9ROSI|nr:hypothetical protein DKX38_027047 [Salix brachista]